MLPDTAWTESHYLRDFNSALSCQQKVQHLTLTHRTAREQSLDEICRCRVMFIEARHCANYSHFTSMLFRRDRAIFYRCAGRVDCGPFFRSHVASVGGQYAFCQAI